MSVFQIAVVFAAAFIAGMINSVAGGGTLVSFPSLIWVGIDPVVANATNTLALWPGSLSAMAGYRRELAGSRRWVLMLGGPSLFGGILGAILLLRTPSPVFEKIVPFLIFGATMLLAVQDPIAKLLNRHPHAAPTRKWWIGAIVFQFFVGVYGGYFGAGIGILMLAALGLLGLTDIHQMNGMKNFFALCINGIAAIYFAGSGAVLWRDAMLMAAGAIIGGYGGAGLARKLGRRFVRRAVIVIGFGMALSLLLRSHS